jgi:hypothetical protein
MMLPADIDHSLNGIPELRSASSQVFPRGDAARQDGPLRPGEATFAAFSRDHKVHTSSPLFRRRLGIGAPVA